MNQFLYANHLCNSPVLNRIMPTGFDGQCNFNYKKSLHSSLKDDGMAEGLDLTLAYNEVSIRVI